MKKGEKIARAPLLWILLPFGFGIFVSSLFAQTLTVLAILVGSGAAILFAIFGRGRQPAWLPLIVILSLCSGIIRHETRIDKTTSNTVFTARETELTLYLIDTFPKQSGDRQSGIARILNAPTHLKHLEQLQIYFSLGASDFEPLESESYRSIGVLRQIENTTDENGFNAYLNRRGIRYRYQQGSLKERISKASPMTQFSQSSRNHLSSFLERNALPDSQYTSAFKALLLGLKQELSPEQKDLFLKNGAMHLFAISGLHIGVVASCIHYLLLLTRIPTKYRPYIVLLFVLSFVITTGGAASSWRAFIMTLCFYLCSLGRRQNAPITGLILSCLAYLALYPEQLFQAGFQMSYFTVASILLIGLPLAKTLNAAISPMKDIPRELHSKTVQRLLKFKSWILTGFAVSTSAFMTAGILGAYYFQVFPSYGILTNLIALPLASLAIIAGFISILFSSVGLGIVALVFNNAAIVIIGLIHWILEKIAALPFAAIAIENTNAFFVFLALLAILSIAAAERSLRETSRRQLWRIAPFAISGFSMIAILALN